MFGREFTGKGHRQHVLPPNPTSYSFEKVGSTKKALGLSGLSVGDEVYWYGGGDDVDTSASGVIVELPAVDPDGRVHSDMAAVEWSDDGYEIVEINNLLNAEHYNIGQGYSQALGSRKQASSLTWGHESPEQSLLGQEGWFANSGDGFHASIFEADDYIQLVPGAQRFDVDIYTDSNNYEHVSVNESGFESVDEAKSFVEGVFERSRVASRTAAGKCPKCDGMGRETYETDTGSLSTQTCTACGGTGQAKEAARKTAAVTWYDQSDQFGGMWSTYQGSAPDSPNGQISESNGTYRWYVSDSGTRGNQQTGESSSLEEAKREAESALASLGITASRTANRRTAFLDTVHLAEPRHRVAGWDWDDHLNGFIAAEAAREFTCACGDNVPAPGYTDCRCGKRWNVYSVHSGGATKFISREVPVRENVVMASFKTASGWEDQGGSDGRPYFKKEYGGDLWGQAYEHKYSESFLWYLILDGRPSGGGTASSLEDAQDQADIAASKILGGS